MGNQLRLRNLWGIFCACFFLVLKQKTKTDCCFFCSWGGTKWEVDKWTMRDDGQNAGACAAQRVWESRMCGDNSQVLADVSSTFFGWGWPVFGHGHRFWGPQNSAFPQFNFRTLDRSPKIPFFWERCVAARICEAKSFHFSIIHHRFNNPSYFHEVSIIRLLSIITCIVFKLWSTVCFGSQIWDDSSLGLLWLPPDVMAFFRVPSGAPDGGNRF